jgi:hypothetical protein
MTTESDPMPTKTPPAKKKKTGRPAAPPVRAVPALEPHMMNDTLLAIHDKARDIDDARTQLDALIAESDVLIREAVDEGERYRDIAAAAGRTVPWVQMSLRREAGVSTHPAAPIPEPRVRKARRAS